MSWGISATATAKHGLGRSNPTAAHRGLWLHASKARGAACRQPKAATHSIARREEALRKKPRPSGEVGANLLWRCGPTIDQIPQKIASIWHVSNDALQGLTSMRQEMRLGFRRAAPHNGFGLTQPALQRRSGAGAPPAPDCALPYCAGAMKLWSFAKGEPEYAEPSSAKAGAASTARTANTVAMRRFMVFPFSVGSALKQPQL
jgi:hypothetical protein